MRFFTPILLSCACLGGVTAAAAIDLFVPLRVTGIKATYSGAPRPDRKALLLIHADGIAPKTGYLEPMLMPKGDRLSGDGYLEYTLVAIPNVEEGIVGPTPITADGEYLFDPRVTGVRGVRVFGEAGSKAERKLP